MTEREARLAAQIFTEAASVAGHPWKWHVEYAYPSQCSHCGGVGLYYNPREGICYEEAGGCGKNSHPNDDAWVIQASPSIWLSLGDNPEKEAYNNFVAAAWKAVYGDERWTALS